MLTQKRALELLSYNPETGIVIWLVSRGGHRAGSEAGCNHPREGGSFERRIRVEGTLYRVARIIWLMVKGEWPNQIDHEDHNPLNNRWNNLRNVTSQGNNQNQSLRKDNTSGHLGVFWEKDRKKWRAQINTSGKKYHLGLFDKKSDAIKARKRANEKFGFHKNHGTSKIIAI